MISILIITISFLLLIPFYKTRSYLSVWGGLDLLIGLSALSLRIKSLGLYPTRFFIRETVFVSGVFVATITLAAIAAFIILKKDNLFRLKSAYFWKLLAAYLAAGFLQQLFFQFVFLETIYFLVKGNALFAVLLSAIFFSLFHFKKEIRKFYFLTLTMGFFYSGAYLIYGNLFWLALSHTVLGTFLYVLFFDDNLLTSWLGRELSN
jgi:membrane protease YdiL (CAAX protease family)